MNKYSCFIEDRVYFGNYPSDESASFLEENGVICFVNLTCPHEKLPDYKIGDKSMKINYYIQDRSYPKNIQTFSILIIKIKNIFNKLKYNEKIYVHCRGGHGRSGILAACLLHVLKNIPIDRSLYLINESHSNREGVREKWKKIGCPQTYGQKKFVYNMFQPLYFYKAYKNGSTIGLSNYSNHNVITSIGKFKSSEAAYYAHKFKEDTYIDKIKHFELPYKIKHFVEKYKGKIFENWDKKKYNIMQNILLLKIKQNDDIKETLLKSGLRPLICFNKRDNYWGTGNIGNGHNHLGKIWMKIRYKIYEKYDDL